MRAACDPKYGWENGKPGSEVSPTRKAVSDLDTSGSVGDSNADRRHTPEPGNGGPTRSHGVDEDPVRPGRRNGSVRPSNDGREARVMAAHSAADGDRMEPCERCGLETPHEVRIEIRTESTDRENAEFSREPYRVATCVSCGNESATRMNSA